MTTQNPDFLHDRIRQLEQMLATARHNAAHWKARFDLQGRAPSPNAVTFDLPSDLHGMLYREATLRFVKPDALVKKIIEIVVRDRLYNAVLDQ